MELGQHFNERAVFSLTETIEHRRDIITKIKETKDGVPVGGIVPESFIDTEGTSHTVVHIGDPFAADPTVYSFVSPLTPDEVIEIRDRIFPLQEAYKILEALAMGHMLRAPVVLQGDPSVGKTFLIARFTELLSGKGEAPVDFYCHKGTESSDLKGKWVPDRVNDGLFESWGELLQERSEDRDPSTQESQDRLLELAGRTGMRCFSGTFGFELGAIPKAMMFHRDPDGNISYVPGGRGKPLHIEEVGQAQAGVVNGLLEMRGDGGKLADAIQLHELNGAMIPAGECFNLFMSTNPPAGRGMQQRTEIDAALANGCIWVDIPRLSEASLKVCARRYFAYTNRNLSNSATNRIIDLAQHQELAHVISDVVAKFHREFEDIAAQGEPGRAQAIPVTLRDLSLVADYMNSFQIRSDPGKVNLVETLRQAVDFNYLGKIRDSKLREIAKKQLDTLLSQVATGSIKFRGATVTPAQAIDTLCSEAMKSEIGINSDYMSEYKYLKEALKEKQGNGRFLGGIFAEECYRARGNIKSIVHICNPFKPDPVIVSIESPLSIEDIQSMRRDRIYPIREAYEILESVALSYRLGAPVLLEGDTSVGKTHMLKCFAEILSGKARPMVDFYCSIQTEPSALLGKWSPQKVSERAEQEWHNFLTGEFGQELLRGILDDIQPLVNSRRVTPEIGAAMIRERLRDAAAQSGAFRGESEFAFEPGAITKAMTAQQTADGGLEYVDGGDGCLLHLQEIGCAHPSLLGSLLLLGGDGGTTAKSIQVHEGRGETVRAGKRFFVAMSTNPPEDSGMRARNSIDMALASRVRYRYVEGLRDESALVASQCALECPSRALDRKPTGCILDFYRHSDLCAALTEVVAPLHQRIRKDVELHEKGQRQKVPVTMRTLEMFVSFLVQAQSIGNDGMAVDLVSTIKNGVRSVYLPAHQSQAVHTSVHAELKRLLDEPVTFEGVAVTREEKIQRLTRRALLSSSIEDRAEDEVITEEEALLVKLSRELSGEIARLQLLEDEAQRTSAASMIQGALEAIIKSNKEIPKLLYRELESLLDNLDQIQGREVSERGSRGERVAMLVQKAA